MNEPGRPQYARQPAPLTCRNTGCRLSGWRDLNPRPLRPERSALPSCATPRWSPASLAEPGRMVSPPASAGWPRAGRRTGPARTATYRGLRTRAAGPCGRAPTRSTAPWPGGGAGRSWSPARPAAARRAARRGCGRRAPGRSRRPTIGSRTRRYGAWVTPERQVGRGVGRARDLGVPVGPDVRVVGADQLDLPVVDLEPGPGVVQVQPAGGEEARRAGPRWAAARLPSRTSRCGQQVARPGS